MRRNGCLFLADLVFLASCQTAKTPMIIQADGRTYTLPNSERVPAELLSQIRVKTGPHDRLLFPGAALPLDSPLRYIKGCTLSVRRAVPRMITGLDGIKMIQTSAQGVGQALIEAGYSFFMADRLKPSAATSITGRMKVPPGPLV